MLRIVILTALMAMFATQAEAKRHHREKPVKSTVTEFCGERYGTCYDGMWPNISTEERAAPQRTRRVKHHESSRVHIASYSTESSRIVPNPQGCPRVSFCGCALSVHILGKNIKSLWLARAWLRFPRATVAAGMVAVRTHHVFAILKDLGRGMVLAFDPNSGGHKTRIHVRSLAGFTVVNPHVKIAGI